jgi:hypothetical protein
LPVGESALQGWSIVLLMFDLLFCVLIESVPPSNVNFAQR